MSADNWAVCPCCLSVAEQEADALRHLMDQSYGKIPLAEFDDLRKRAETPINMEAITTFREDYEFYGAEEGTIHMSYAGHCSVCSTSITINEQYPFFPKTGTT